MDTKTHRAWSAEKSEELLHEKIEKIAHNAEDRCLTCEEVHAIKDAWKAIWYIKQVTVEEK